ncbi:hypothetical protein [Thalassobellus citreus]|uniref:hypothetical protein n=1 Tax=Thalassobellus citreus TaxID=3367752 RepID=UPI00379E1D04
MKQLFLILFLGCFTSCIPLRIAPSIKTDKVMLAKKFKRTLPKAHAFVFEDPKDANEFYNYVNTKYELYHQDVDRNVPFDINDNEVLYFSFHEVEIPDKTLNFLPFIIDTALKSKDFDPILEDAYVSRSGNWYIAITVTDDALNDCLKPDNIHYQSVLKYLKDLRMEYINTQNYIEALLRR